MNRTVIFQTYWNTSDMERRRSGVSEFSERGVEQEREMVNPEQSWSRLIIKCSERLCPIDSKGTTTVKAQKSTKMIYKVVHVTSERKQKEQLIPHFRLYCVTCGRAFTTVPWRKPVVALALTQSRHDGVEHVHRALCLVFNVIMPDLGQHRCRHMLASWYCCERTSTSDAVETKMWNKLFFLFSFWCHMDYFVDHLGTFLCLDRGSSLAVYGRLFVKTFHLWAYRSLVDRPLASEMVLITCWGNDAEVGGLRWADRHAGPTVPGCGARLSRLPGRGGPSSEE